MPISAYTYLAVADGRQLVEALAEWLKAPEQSSLNRTFTVWLKRVLLPRRLPTVALPELDELSEVKSMLAERVKEWTEHWRQEGKALQAKTSLLTLLQIRFGAVPEEINKRIEAINDLSVLETLFKFAATVESLTAFQQSLDMH